MEAGLCSPWGVRRSNQGRWAGPAGPGAGAKVQPAPRGQAPASHPPVEPRPRARSKVTVLDRPGDKGLCCGVTVYPRGGLLLRAPGMLRWAALQSRQLAAFPTQAPSGKRGCGHCRAGFSCGNRITVGFETTAPVRAQGDGAGRQSRGQGVWDGPGNMSAQSCPADELFQQGSSPHRAAPLRRR